MPTAPIPVAEFSPGNLYERLSNALFTPADVGSHTQATYLAAYLTDLSARTIVIEDPYTDGDYLDDFASFYVKCYQDYPRRCKRLHFFSAPYTEADTGLVRGDPPRKASSFQALDKPGTRAHPVPA